MSWVLLGLLTLTASLSSGSASGALVTRATQNGAVVLRDLEVEGDAEQVVITLTADGPIAGELQRIAGGATRLYVDLEGVRPRIDALTPVNRGPVLRIRVALNSANPPVTRVVLDVSNAPPARIEPGETDHALRIIVGALPQTPAAMEKPAGAASATAPAAEVVWCRDVAERLSGLLDNSTPSTSQPAMLAAAAAWEALEREIEARKVSAALQPVHFMLLQSVRLGRIATTYRNGRELEQAAAAQSGARLLLNTAEDRLEQMR